jgi:hypothetical protein
MTDVDKAFPADWNPPDWPAEIGVLGEAIPSGEQSEFLQWLYMGRVPSLTDEAGLALLRATIAYQSATQKAVLAYLNVLLDVLDNQTRQPSLSEWAVTGKRSEA